MDKGRCRFHHPRHIQSLQFQLRRDNTSFLIFFMCGESDLIFITRLLWCDCEMFYQSKTILLNIVSSENLLIIHFFNRISVAIL